MKSSTTRNSSETMSTRSDVSKNMATEATSSVICQHHRIYVDKYVNIIRYMSTTMSKGWDLLVTSLLTPQSNSTNLCPSQNYTCFTHWGIIQDLSKLTYSIIIILFNVWYLLLLRKGAKNSPISSVYLKKLNFTQSGTIKITFHATKKAYTFEKIKVFQGKLLFDNIFFVGDKLLSVEFQSHYVFGTFSFKKC